MHAFLCVLLNKEKAMPAMLGMAVILASSWNVMRLIFIYYRLEQMSRPRRRHRLGHACASLLILPLALGVPASVVLSVTQLQANPAWLVL